MKFFNPLKVSSKFPICNIPLRLDSYNYCNFNCKYCFSNNRMIGSINEKRTPNLQWLENKFIKCFDDKDIDESSFLEVLLSDGVTLHGGSICDCFHYDEDKYHYTKDIVELCNNYDLDILWSTKSDTYYDVPVNNEHHSFQLTFTDTKDNPLETNTPSFTKRYQFYKQLKNEGYNVGIRIQPYIPNKTDIIEIITLFNDADHFTIEGIKLVPGNKLNNELLNELNLKKEDFTNMGLLNLKPSLRLHYYKEAISYFEDNNLSYSIADNDLHYIGNNKSCCGDKLIKKGLSFSNTSLIKEYGLNYTIDDVYKNARKYLKCNCSGLYNSSRRNDCKTVKDFYEDRFYRKTAIYSPSFQYTVNQTVLDDYK